MKFVSLFGQNRRGDWSKVVLVAVEVLTVGDTPLAAVVVRISKGERDDFGAAAPFSTKTSSLQGGAGYSAFTPKLVKHFGPAWTLFAEQLPPCFT